MGAPRPLLAGTLLGELALASILATAGGIALGLLLGTVAANQTASLLADRLGVDLALAPLAPGGFLLQLLVAAPLFVAVAAAPAIRKALSAELVED